MASRMKRRKVTTKMFSKKDSWQSVTSIIDYYGDNQDTLIPLAGPGHWNDPDMVSKLSNKETQHKLTNYYFTRAADNRKFRFELRAKPRPNVHVGHHGVPSFNVGRFENHST